MNGVPGDVPPLPSSIELRGAGLNEDLDPELLALPSPRRRERTFALVVLVFAGLAALAMAFGLRGDVVYALSSPSATDLGK